jgi:molybdopterin synthase sulfur carrier subunit
MVDLLYFAWVRESIGIGHECATPPAEVADVAGLIDWLAARGGGYAEALGDKTRLRAAIDQLFVPLDAPIAEAREIALFPPVTGG